MGVRQVIEYDESHKIRRTLHSRHMSQNQEFGLNIRQLGYLEDIEGRLLLARVAYPVN
jgi:hypothetical protein